MRRASILAASCVLAHVPGLVRYGSKPMREIRKDGGFLSGLESRLRSFDEAAAYPPNQVFIGNLPPQALREVPSPWYGHLIRGAAPAGPFGEILPEDGFLALLKKADVCGLVRLSEGFARRMGLDASGPSNHPGEGRAAEPQDDPGDLNSLLPLLFQGEAVGAVRRDHEEDDSLKASVLLENLACKASAFLALDRLLNQPGVPDRGSLDFLISCSEEAVGDRYQRGGGNLAKAVGEMAGLSRASGADIKNFCASPVQALIFAGSLVVSGLFNHVAVVAGGSLPKLGMKAAAHLEREMPILEDVLAGFAAWVAADGEGPRIRLDGVGLHRIGAGSSQQAILESLAAEPLARLGLRISEIPLYATELHNPEITVPAGGGDVPRNNYRLLGALAALRGEIGRSEIDRFVEEHGLPGFSPSQGHIASAVPALPHVLRRFREGELSRAFFLAKGSLFLGRMTQLADGVSFLLDAG
ncbi:MAG: glycine reductase [Candidatus Tectomicrobia bacterium]|nr:glycine reductase [Candidatus Tectomicrobia bacterium]